MWEANNQPSSRSVPDNGHIQLGGSAWHLGMSLGVSRVLDTCLHYLYIIIACTNACHYACIKMDVMNRHTKKATGHTDNTRMILDTTISLATARDRYYGTHPSSDTINTLE